MHPIHSLKSAWPFQLMLFPQSRPCPQEKKKVYFPHPSLEVSCGEILLDHTWRGPIAAWVKIKKRDATCPTNDRTPRSQKL